MVGKSGAKAKKARISLTKSQLLSSAGVELLALCQTITEDGSLSNQEIENLQQWLEVNRSADLPAKAFLLAKIEQILADGKVTKEERKEVYAAIEAVLPPDVRRSARQARIQFAEQERSCNRPLHRYDFMVAGVRYEDRPAVIRRYASEGVAVFVIRDRNNRFSRNAVEVRVGNGMQIGFVPEEFAENLAPLLDSGHQHRGYIKKMLGSEATPIPVVVADIFEPNAAVAGAVPESAVPRKPSQLEARVSEHSPDFDDDSALADTGERTSRTRSSTDHLPDRRSLPLLAYFVLGACVLIVLVALFLR